MGWINRSPVHWHRKRPPNLPLAQAGMIARSNRTNARKVSFLIAAHNDRKRAFLSSKMVAVLRWEREMKRPLKTGISLTCSSRTLEFHAMVYWPHFDVQRTKAAGGDANCLVQNHVSVSMPAGSTHWDHVYAIAKTAYQPFKVKFVAERLKESQFVRGRACFGNAGNEIQNIVMNYPTLRWWMEADGLVIDEPAAEVGPLKDFDRFAGELVAATWAEGHLAEQDFIAIAKQLDEKGFVLKACLQPAQWKLIAEHNQKYARGAIKTFEAAAIHPRFSRAIRRRLYLARDRYLNAQRPVEPIYF